MAFRILEALGIRSRKGRALEEEGDLRGALEAYARSGDREAALRVALLLADAEARADERLLLLGRAASYADGEAKKAVERRYQRARLDVIKGSVSQGALRGELRDIGAALEAISDWDGAADAYRAAGDADGETRVLVASGEIDRLEDVLSEEQEKQASSLRLRELTAQIVDLDRAGQRRAALDVAAPHRARVADIERVAARIEGRRCDAARAHFEVDGERATWVLGARVVLGRGLSANVMVRSPVVARTHLALERDGDAIVLRDLGTTNGTWLAGLRVAGPIRLENSLSVKLGDVPCDLQRDAFSVRVCVGGEVYRVALGEARVGPFVLTRPEGSAWLRVSKTPTGPAPIIGDSIVTDGGVDLAIGDELRAERSGPVLLRVLP